MGHSHPVVIGATGGSGTRVVVRFLEALGVSLGRTLNESLDPYVFMSFYDRWIDPFVAERMGRGALSRRERSKMARDLQEAVQTHLADANPVRGARWGWKSPRSIFVLPLLDQAFPRMRFVHVVRDPRDMAFSNNQRQLVAHGPLYLREEERAEPLAIRSALMWKRVNSNAWVHGASMGERYLLVRYEDLCLDGRGGAASLASFLGIPAEDRRLDEAASHVSAPSSIGRWRQEDPALVDRIDALLGEDLESYGYRR